MKYRLALTITLLLVLLSGIFVFRSPDGVPEAALPPPHNPPSGNIQTPTAPPLGDALVEQYADPATPPVKDLQKVNHVVENMLLLFKNLDTRLVSTNAELAAFLRGNNCEKLVFLSPGSSVFGPDGTLVDRWQSPYFIHPNGTGLLEIRSAGLDRELFTDDDLSLLPDGNIESGVQTNR